MTTRKAAAADEAATTEQITDAIDASDVKAAEEGPRSLLGPPPDFRPPGYRRALTEEQIGALMADLNPHRVSTRRMQGKDLSYVEAYECKAALIRIFGFGGFSSEVIESRIIDIRDNGRQGKFTSGDKEGQDKTPYVMAQATVRLTIHNIGPAGQDVHYTETAVGTNDGWTIGDIADNAIKSAASDAFKRCAIFLGTQLGLSLYANGSKADVVRVLLEPEQKALLTSWREKREAEKNPEAAKQVTAALGGTVVAPQSDYS
jgi:recombination DNA repair RAD52 pathway protein